MDGKTIHAKVYAGRAKAAARIGLDCALFRPQAAASPWTQPLGTIKAAFNAGDNSYRAPNLYGKPIWFGDFDGRLTQPGDYLVRSSDGNVWFIAGQQQLLPIVCIDCDRSVRITRQAAQTAVGAVGYGGQQPANNTDVLGSADTPWPASILAGSKGATALGLPTDAPQGGWQVLLPPSVPVIILAGDILTDDLGRRYTVAAAESTDLGWRIRATEAHV